MKTLLLASLLALPAYADGVHRDQGSVDATAANESSQSAASTPVETTTPSVTAPSNGCPFLPACANSCLTSITDCAQPLVAHTSPFVRGMVGGLALACLQTKVVDPLFALCSDEFVVSLEALGFASALTAAYVHRETSTVGELKKPATLVGVLAGLVAWYSFCG